MNRVVLWGARRGDRQFGSPEDRRTAALQSTIRALQRRGTRRAAVSAELIRGGRS